MKRKTTKKCEEFGCERKSGDYIGYFLLQVKNASPIEIVTGILFIIILSMTIIAYPVYSVDEEGFCKEKISTYFPEKVNSGSYYRYGVENKECYVYTLFEELEEKEKRDGLILRGYGAESTRQRFGFRLTNQEDIDYLERDDESAYVFLIALILIICFSCWVANIADDYSRYKEEIKDD